MESLDMPSEQPGTIKKHHAPHSREILHSKKDQLSPEPTPVPDPPWADLADPGIGSDWLE